MVINRTLICDCCARSVHTADTATDARKQAQDHGDAQRIDGRDLCRDCVVSQYPNMQPATATLN